MEDLQVHILFSHSFQGHKQGTAESKKHDSKYNTESTHVPIDDLGKGFSVQACGTRSKKEGDLFLEVFSKRGRISFSWDD